MTRREANWRQVGRWVRWLDKGGVRPDEDEDAAADRARAESVLMDFTGRPTCDAAAWAEGLAKASKVRGFRPAVFKRMTYSAFAKVLEACKAGEVPLARYEAPTGDGIGRVWIAGRSLPVPITAEQLQLALAVLTERGCANTPGLQQAGVDQPHKTIAKLLQLEGGVLVPYISRPGKAGKSAAGYSCTIVPI